MKNFKIIFISVFILGIFLISCSNNENAKEANLASQNSLFMRTKELPEPPDTQVPGPICLRNSTQSQAILLGTNFTPEDNILYDIRDNFLRKSTKGYRYIGEYYYCGNTVKDYSGLTISDINSVIDLMPHIYSSYEKMQDSSYQGIIIDNTTSNKLINVLNIYKSLSNDTDYNSIIDDLKNDVIYVEGKNKSQINNFMKTN